MAFVYFLFRNGFCFVPCDAEHSSSQPSKVEKLNDKGVNVFLGEFENLNMVFEEVNLRMVIASYL